MPPLALDISTTLGLGRDATALTFAQISLRGVIVFAAALVIVRCGDRRFLSQKTAFDAVLGFILASMLARAVNGTAASFQHSVEDSFSSSCTGFLRPGRADLTRSACSLRVGAM